MINHSKALILLKRLVYLSAKTQDISLIKKFIVYNLGRVFNADRCAIRDFDPKENKFLKPEPTAEYLASDKTKSVADYLFLNEFDEILKIILKKTPLLIINDTQDFIEKNNLKGTIFEDFTEKFSIKSGVFYLIVSYQKHLMGVFSLYYIKEKTKLIEADIQLIKTFLRLAGSTIYRIKQTENIRESAERDRVLRKIIETIRSTLDISEIKKAIVKESCHLLNADRVFIMEYDREKNIFLPPDDSSTYSIPGVTELKEETGENFEKYKTYIDALKNKEMIVHLDTEELIKKGKVFDPITQKTIKNLNIKATLTIPIVYLDELIGGYAFHFGKPYSFGVEEVKLAQDIANQAGIALYQARLYAQQSKTAERESLLRKITETIRDTLDIKKTMKISVEEIGKNFQADWCFISEYDEKNKKYKPIEKYSQYLSSPETKSLEGYDWSLVPEFTKLFANGEEIFFSSRTDMHEKANLIGGPYFAETNKLVMEKYAAEAGAAIPIFYQDKHLGVLVFNYKYPKTLSIEEINLARALAGQIGTAINQAKLYKDVKQRVKREWLLRKITETLRNTLDIKETIKRSVSEIARVFDADRCFITEYDEKNNKYKPVQDYSEYLATPETKSLEGYDWSLIPEIGEKYKRGEEEIFFNQEEEYEKYLNQGKLELVEGIKFILEKFDIQTGIGIPIFHQDKFLGVLGFNYNTPRGLSKEELKLARTLAGQIGIAINQARLYEKEHQTAEREALLRRVSQAIRSSLDLDEALTTICDEVARLYGVQRATIVEYPDPKNYKNWIVRREYKKTPKIKGLSDIDYQKRTGKYIGAVVVRDSKNLVIDNIPESDTPKYFKRNYTEMGIKAALSVSIKKGEDKWGIIYLSEYENYRHWTIEEIKFLEDIADQIYIAINQANLYTALKITVDRERLFRDITEIIRSSINIDEMKKNIVTEIGKLFGFDRCAMMLFDEKNKKFLPVDENGLYMSSPEIETHVGIDIEKGELRAFKERLQFEDKEIFISDMDNPPADINPTIVKILKNYNIKSNYSFHMKYKGELIGFIYTNYVKEKKCLNEEDIKFLKSIGDQAGIGINQAKLFEAQKQTAETEKLLREIISEIKISQTIEEAYCYILKKLAEIFDTDRCVFIEVPHYMYDKSSVKYEYLRNKNLPSIKDKKFPDFYTVVFQKAMETNVPFVINEVLSNIISDKKSLEFAINCFTKSALAVPLIRYNRSKKLLGIIALCSFAQRDWTEKEIELLKSITGTVVNVVWNISKLMEIEELRNTFILTLAHDLQVPVIGEQKALEYINTQSDHVELKDIKPLLEELVDNNKSINETLSKLIDIYNYEMRHKKLEYSNQAMEWLVNDVYTKLREMADKKAVSVNILAEESLPLINVDKKEIEKALYIILENAIEYSPENNEVTIELSKTDIENMSVCISDNGPGFPPEFEELIFKRYEMIKVLGRKIGAGLSLYLVKLIINEHGGAIRIESKEGQGTTFCVYLPIKKNNLSEK